jgi:hypothetical protein
MFLDTKEKDRILGEEPSLHHLLKGRKRQEQRTVHRIHATDGTLQTSSADILSTSTDHMHRNYDHIPVNDGSMRLMMDCVILTIPPTANTTLDKPITMDEHYMQ